MISPDGRHSPSRAEWHEDGTALPADPRVSLHGAVRTLWRRRGMFLSVFLPILLAGFAYLLLMPERYTAHGLLMVGVRQPELVSEGPRDLNRSEPDIDGAIELMRTRPALRHVVQELDLTARPEFASAINSTTLPPVRRLRHWAQSLLGTHKAAAPEARERDATDVIATQLGKDIKVERVGRSPLLDVGYASTDPVLAASVVNAAIRFAAEDESFLASMTLAERSGFQIVKTSVIAAAAPPNEPASPSAARMLGGTVFCAFAAALSAALYREFRAQQTVLSMEDVTRRGLRVLGLIPANRAVGRRRAAGVALVASDPSHVFSASVTSLHAAVSTLPRPRDGGAPVLLVTSALPGEGKSTTAAALATSMAASGSRVLLIDADLRSPTLHRSFEIGPGPGLAECVDRLAPADRAVRQDRTTGVFLLAAGEARARPLRVLGSAQLHNLLDQWRTQFDTILIDSPPILAAGDARLLGQVSDCAIVVTRWGYTSWTALDHALRALAESGARVAGITVSRADVRQLGSYGYTDARILRIGARPRPAS